MWYNDFMEINYVNEYDFTFGYTSEFNNLATAIQEHVKLEESFVCSCIFVDDSYIQTINREFRSIDTPTDVISFALLDEDSVLVVGQDEIELGDIFINIDACKRQAIEYGHSFKRELCFLFVHGLLHLFGYDHIEVEDEEIMFSLQKEILDATIPR